MARILIVDDIPEMRDLARLRLEQAGHEIVGEAETGRSGIAMAERTQPDAVVLDVMMPEMSGLEALPEIVAAAPRSRILVFSSLPEITLADVRRLGGPGLLDKIDQFRLDAAIAAVLAG